MNTANKLNIQKQRKLPVNWPHVLAAMLDAGKADDEIIFTIIHPEISVRWFPACCKATWRCCAKHTWTTQAFFKQRNCSFSILTLAHAHVSFYTTAETHPTEHMSMHTKTDKPFPLRKLEITSIGPVHIQQHWLTYRACDLLTRERHRP